jgi:hypothetical protein
MIEVEIIDLDLALDELGYFEDVALALDWHVFFCLWFNGAVIPAASC